jgi:RNA 3'-terminal phosphate cyclase (ATP)
MLGVRDPSELTLTGGTHVSTSPSFHFLDTTWRGYLEKMGFRLRLRLVRPGFYPRGGGQVEVHLQPCEEVRPLRIIERGEVRITGFSAVAGLPENIARRQARRAVTRLRQKGFKAALDEDVWDGGPGTVVALELDTLPPTLFFALGERGKPAEKVADEAVDQVLSYVEAGAKAAVDPHSADQIVLPLSLAKGPSEYTTTEVTRHLLTNIAVIGRFIERDIVVEGVEGNPGRVRIR